MEEKRVGEKLQVTLPVGTFALLERCAAKAGLANSTLAQLMISRWLQDHYAQWNELYSFEE